MAITNHEFASGITQLVEQQGIEMREAVDRRWVMIVDHLDGQGPQLAMWNTGKLGPTPNEQQIRQAAAILEAQQTAKRTEESRLVQVVEDARATAQSVPGWATWTQTEAEAWLDANIESDIKTTYPNTYLLLQKLVQMVIAMRNETWPDLEGS